MQIGEQLKEARREKNLKLDDIQVATKIQKRYLVAIEQGDYHALPGRFYARAFIKEYANAVDLDAEVLLASFDDSETATKEEEETIKYSRMKRTQPADGNKGSSILSFLPSVIVVLLIISILIVAWTLYQKSLSKPSDERFEEHESEEIIQRTPDDLNPAPTDDDTKDLDENSDDNVEKDEAGDDNNDMSGTFTVVEAGTGSSPESTVKYETSSDTITVKLEGRDDSYVQVRTENGRSHFDGMFHANMTEEIDVPTNERLYFNVGHAPGLTIYVNDEQLEFPVEPTERVHQKIWLEFN